MTIIVTIPLFYVDVLLAKKNDPVDGRKNPALGNSEQCSV